MKKLTRGEREKLHRLIRNAGRSSQDWELYLGGNFVRVGVKGYGEWVKKHSYAGGPFSIAEIEWKATDTLDANPKRARAIGRLIVAAHNSLPSLLAQIDELETALARLERNK